MNKNQKKFFTIAFTVFVAFLVYFFNELGVLSSITEGQAMLFAVFVALCAIPFYVWTKKNKVKIDSFFEK